MSPKVLLVDDDRLILATLSKGLQMSGYEVISARSSGNALSEINRQSIDIAILDIKMPEISGIELAQHLVARHIPVIFLSAYSDDQTLQEACEVGCCSYLIKPCSLQQIALTIETVLARIYDLKQLKEQNRHLENALNQSRDIAIAIGLTMSSHKIEKDEAFSMLRDYARMNRKKVVDVAAELIQQAKTENFLNLPSKST